MDELKYIPRIVDLCWVRGYGLDENRSSLSYNDTTELYRVCLEVNPDLSYSNFKTRIPPKFGESSKTPKENSKKFSHSSEPAEESKEEHIPSLEETISIVDFRDMTDYYKEEVIGQEEAINDISKVLINVRHMGMPKDGVASYYLLGPSGVGKTSSIKFLSGFLGIPLCYIQGSEYKESHSDSKLFGAPPSYIGYNEEGGILTKYIKKNPQGIILFDEIDKVHPAIYGTLTNFLGDGFVINPAGEECDFNGFVFFTSNTGNKLSEQGMGRGIGFQSEEISESERDKKRIIEILRQEGIQEAFLGRMNDFIRFGTLGHEHLLEILDKKIDKVNTALKYYNINLSSKAKNKIIQLGNPDLWGARNIFHNLEKFVISELNFEFEMNRDIEEGKIVDVDFDDTKFVYLVDRTILMEKEAV